MVFIFLKRVLCALLMLAAARLNASSPSLAALRSVAPESPGLVIALEKGSESRLVLLSFDGSTRRIAEGFHSAADPEISFDGKRVLFSARRAAADRWQIFEAELATGEVRQIASVDQDCLQPAYQSAIFNLAVTEPWRQVVFASEGSLWSVKLDGTELSRLTWTPSVDSHPLMLPDGRVIYSSRLGGQSGLFGINLDGTDYALFANLGIRDSLPGAVTVKDDLVFVEGARLGAVSLARPLRTKRWVTMPGAGQFGIPGALPDGTLLAPYRADVRSGWKLARVRGAAAPASVLYAEAGWNVTRALLAAPRKEPDGRGSVVDAKEATAKIYCLSVYSSDRPMPAGSARRVRVLETPDRQGKELRILGEADLAADGSFQLQVPANLPMKVQVLDASGKVLRTSGWMYARNKENRGCIGCHEDPELTPPNRLAEALNHKAPLLTLPPEMRQKAPPLTTGERRVLHEWKGTGTQQ